jgi:hypothetical protein
LGEPAPEAADEGDEPEGDHQESDEQIDRKHGVQLEVRTVRAA